MQPLRSHLLGAPGPAVNASSTGARGDLPPPPPNKSTGKPKAKKTVSQEADAMLKKAALKITAAEGLESLLRRAGVCLS